MNELQWWQQKLRQTLHDPVHKGLILGSGIKHFEEAGKLFKAIIDQELKGAGKRPDRLATGADRPHLGSGRQCRVDWRKAPLITHPLQPGACFRPPAEKFHPGKGARRRVRALTEELVAYWEAWFEAVARASSEHESADASEVRAGAWHDAARLRAIQWAVWRQASEWTRSLGIPFPWLPADTRAPDHSIENHTRMASAAAFLVGERSKNHPPEREPCLLAVSVRGVQKFIAESRKTRDLWTACMIFAELAWAGMEPILEQYGPDAILYPDLRGNPLADQWLWQQKDPVLRDAVPESVCAGGIATYAAVVPNTFTALVPRGGRDHLVAVEDLAGRCREAVARRWRELADAVRSWLRSKAGGGAWTRVWDRQLARGPEVTWSAMVWRRRMDQNGSIPDLQALPGRAEDHPGERLPTQLQAREQALAPWIGHDTRNHYEHARRVFGDLDSRAHLNYLRNERGFDYPLVHHALMTAHRVRKRASSPAPAREPGEKCSVTGRHEVLSNLDPGAPISLGRRRAAARAFWANPRLDPEADGSERLGGPAALKRYLVAAGEETFTRRWLGIEEAAPRDPRVPFPSTAAIASGRFLVEVGRRVESLRGPIQAVLEAASQSPLPAETQDPMSLPRLAPLAAGDRLLKRFYALEPEYLFPEALRTLVDRAGGDESPDGRRIKALLDAGTRLRQALGAGPDTGVAVLVMDGDSMGRLLLGDPKVIAARWEDVLHPEAVRQAREGLLAEVGWPGLLGVSRPMGPALHAAITQMLARFVHRIAPWVVEREYGGRLIYAGGDDLLALLPAGDAIPAAARLQQLFSAPFVVDTMPDLPPWSWRRSSPEAGARAPSPDGSWERDRFRVPRPGYDPDTRRWVVETSSLEYEPHAGTGEQPEAGEWAESADLFPMLGRPHGLSAGMALGHYKTALQTLILSARENLGRAKSLSPRPPRRLSTGDRPLESYRSGIAVSRFTRNGAKDTWVARWRLEAEDAGDPSWGKGGPEEGDKDRAHGPPTVWRELETIIDAFGDNRLARRFPYQLQESLAAMHPLPDHPEDRRRLLEGLIAHHAPQCSLEVKRTVLRVVEAGMEGAGVGRTVEGRGQDRKDEVWTDPYLAARAAVSGVLLARHLSATGGAR